MKKVKAILTHLRASVIPNEFFYSKLIRTSFISSVTYFIWIYSFLSLFVILVFFIKWSPFLLFSYKQVLFESISRFPSNTVIRITNNTLDTMDNKPVMLWFSSGSTQRLLFIASPSIQTFAPKNTPNALLVLGYDSYQIRFLNHFYKAKYSFDVTINKDLLDLFKKTVDTKFVLLLFLFYSILFILIPFLLLFWVILLLVVSTSINYALFRFYHHKISLKKIVQIGLHTSFIPLSLGITLFHLFPINQSIPVMTLFLFIIFHTVGVYESYYALAKQHSNTDRLHKRAVKMRP